MPICMVLVELEITCVHDYMVVNVRYVLERVSFGNKDCTKELKLECAYFLGQTSLFLPFRLHQ